MTSAFAPRWQHHPPIGFVRIGFVPIGFVRIGFVWLAAMVAAACAGSHRAIIDLPEPDPCVLVAPPQSPPESITIALSPALDGAGRNQRRTTAERFVAAQSYETLFGVDCRGRLYPKLARAWSVQRVDGEQAWERWEITLDTSARFWNGDRVTAKDVLAAWRSTANAPSGELARLIAPATAIEDRALVVWLSDSTPLILAHPSLAVHGVRSRAASRVRVHATSATAARDALDGGADLLVTDDPAIVSYAARNDALLTLPLPWDRTYVVLASEGARHEVGAALRLTLANLLVDAVRADSRFAEGPFWWESSNHCTAPETKPVVPARASSRVVYLSGDRVAQGVAERLVALAGSRSTRGEDSVLAALLPRLSREGARAMAVALSPRAFAAAVHSGDELAYVLPLPRFAFAPCHEVAMLLRAAPWLQSVIPLIDTRSIALVRRGRVGLSVDADGSLRLLNGAPGPKGKP